MAAHAAFYKTGEATCVVIMAVAQNHSVQIVQINAQCPGIFLCGIGHAAVKEDVKAFVLNEEGKSVLERYIKAQQDVIICSEQETFIHAFRLGAQMVLDIVGSYRGCFYELAEEAD